MRFGYKKDYAGNEQFLDIPVIKPVILSLLALILLVAICVGGCSGCKEYGRAQKRADARNKTSIVRQQIKTAQQQAKVNYAQIDATKAEAEKRYQEAIGIKRSQLEINKTLTPLYVQHEAIQKIPEGRAIYIPSGAQGIPLVNPVETPPAP